MVIYVYYFMYSKLREVFIILLYCIQLYIMDINGVYNSIYCIL